MGACSSNPSGGKPRKLIMPSSAKDLMERMLKKGKSNEIRKPEMEGSPDKRNREASVLIQQVSKLSSERFALDNPTIRPVGEDYKAQQKLILGARLSGSLEGHGDYNESGIGRGLSTIRSEGGQNFNNTYRSVGSTCSDVSDNIGTNRSDVSASTKIINGLHQAYFDLFKEVKTEGCKTYLPRGGILVR